MKVKHIAQICHDVNKSYCKTIGDLTQKGWDNAPDWQKESAIAGVIFHLQNPNAQPEDSHNSWLKQKEADGWKYGETKDPEKKEHPCFVPYNMLPVQQQKKDLLFISIVNCFRDLVELEDSEEIVIQEGDLVEHLTTGEKFKFSEGQLNSLKNFQILATADQVVKKPVIQAFTETEAREEFLKEFPNGTIHKCEEI